MEKSVVPDVVPRKLHSNDGYDSDSSLYAQSFRGGRYSSPSTPDGKYNVIYSVQEADTFYSKKDAELPGVKFDRRRQLRRLIITGSLRFVLTIGLIASLYGTFVHFETHGLISVRSKRIFNFLVTGISMLLGIAIASSFKDIATNMRWWILSLRKRPIAEVNGILASHSMTEVAKLAFGSARRRNFGLMTGCCLWLLLNLTAQAAVASLGLTYGLNQDPNADPTQPVPGLVSFTNMTQSFARANYNDDDEYDNLSSSQLAAHTFGENALQYLYLPITEGGIQYLSSVYYPTIISYPNETTYSYYFQESQYNAPDQTNTANFYSNRSIAVTTTCISESETSYLTNNPTTSNTTFLVNSTIFYTSYGSSCGPRCAIINATESDSMHEGSGWVYTCNVTVSPVFNASVPAHQVSDSNALIAASAIALQGYQIAADDDIQSQIFPVQSQYGQFLDGNETAMASKLSSFAIGVFASADQTLQLINGSVSGFLPNQGLELDIQDPKYMWAIFGGIAGAHLVLLVCSLCVANRVIVVDDNDLAMALLLRSVANEFAEKGCLLDGEERGKRGRDCEVVYAPRVSGKGGGGSRVLEIGRLGEPVRDPRGWEGFYDS